MGLLNQPSGHGEIAASADGVEYYPVGTVLPGTLEVERVEVRMEPLPRLAHWPLREIFPQLSPGQIEGLQRLWEKHQREVIDAWWRRPR